MSDPTLPSEDPPERTPSHGLTQAEAEERLGQYGPNALATPKGPSAWSILLAQLKSPLVYLILTAALISLVMGEVGDFAIIMAVVVIDAALGFVQEYQAQRTFAALKNLIKPTATVIRDGERVEIEARQLVPGDVVALGAGERVPADGEVLECAKLSVEEAVLTGESEPIQKDSTPGQRELFMGTTVLTGRALMQVTQTGSRTELGKIATSLSDSVEQDTPLQVRMRAFSHTLTRIVVAATLVIFVVGLWRSDNLLQSLLPTVRVSVILAVAAVPEGLLIAVTVVLVLGMRKILKRNGLVKRLLAVETLGSVTVICTDKTGTLTEGHMRVTRQHLEQRQRALEAMVLCNNLEGPIDVALWDHARAELGSNPQSLAERARRLAEEPFSSEHKMMIIAAELDGERTDYLKGAPEIVMGMCSLDDTQRERILAEVEQWAALALRPLGLAYRNMGNLEDRSGYTWAGLVAMEDPVREGVCEAIAVAQHAGIQIKMITGDHRLTAEGIARNVGLEVGPGRVIEGSELTGMSDAQLQERVQGITVFARIRPQDKLRIVSALQARHEVTAMIGDGVNDAPALKRANIGVVVGAAADIAKEQADLILLDNNFRTIVAAVEEGRAVFENIRKVVAYVLSNSFAEVLTILGAMLLRWPTPLLVSQILWIHLICDGPSDIVLGFEPKEEGILDEKPRSLHEPILDRLGISLVGVISVVSAVVALALFGHYWQAHNEIAEARSYAYAMFAVNPLIYVFGYRSLRRPTFRSGSLARNKALLAAVAVGLVMAVGAVLVPPLRSVLGIVPLHLSEWAVISAVAIGMLLTVDVAKIISKRVGARRSTAENGV